MYFEDPDKCPLLEDNESIWDKIPYCTIVYNELTAWTLCELCYKNYEECPAYKEFISKSQK